MSAVAAGYGAGDRILRDFLDAASRGSRSRPQHGSSGWWTLSCPSPKHRGGDRNPSLGVRLGSRNEETIVIKCQLPGCEQEDVLAAIGWTYSDLYADDEPVGKSKPARRRRGGPTQDQPPKARIAEGGPAGPWVYTDDRGTPLYRVVRLIDQDGSKTYRQERSTPKGWAPGFAGYGIVAHPYNWPAVLAAIDAGQTVYITEGEKAAHALIDRGLPATTNHGGAGKWQAYCGRYARHFRGAHVAVLPDNDEAGRQHALQVMESLAEDAASLSLVTLPGLPDKGDVHDWFAAGGTLEQLHAIADAQMTSRPGYEIRCLADVQPEQVSWLWEGRIPAGKITVLDGDPGVGKSTLAIALAATISGGGDWFDGTRAPQGTVLLLSGEDGLADTVRPRLDAAGADPTRVIALDGVPHRTEDGEVIVRDAHLGDITALRQAITDHGVSLMIVDVLMAFLPTGVDSHKDQDVRVVLRRLKTLAEETGVAILLLRHLTKGSAGGSAMYRGGGSIGITGAARMAYLVAKDPDDPARVIVAPTKSNVAQLPTAVAYRLVDAGNGAARVEWLGETDHTADDLTARSGTADAEERDALSEFLRDYVRASGGAASAKQATAAAAEAFGPLGKATLKRARDRAGITTRKNGMSSGWVWCLDGIAEGSAEGSEGSSTQDPGTFGNLHGTFGQPDLSMSAGSCAACGDATQRYGSGGGPLCGRCAAEPPADPDRSHEAS